METLTVEAVSDGAIEKLRAQLFARGARGLRGLARTFRVADFNGNKKLDREEFEEALGFAGCFLSKPEVSALFRRFDRTADGNISYDEFLRGVKGDLNERRKAIVHKAFSVMDRDGSGSLTVDDLRGVFNGSKHPEVLAGRLTEEEVLSDFLEGFEGVAGDRDGAVTIAEFEDYYGDVSASIPSDDYFCEMMESVWMITESMPTKELQAKVAKWADVVREKIRQRTKTGESEAVKLRQTFQFWDSDESGAVTIDEFGRAMERLGIPLARRETTMFFKLFDPDDSGTITYDEFVDYVYRDGLP